jgi:4-diphosphocytidyl-2-C-methyl-D-erythritol kinase
MNTIKAYAKINLALEVLGKRNDGYHEVSTVLHAVGIADYLTFKPGVGLNLVCNKPSISDSDNLVIRAAKVLQKATNCFSGAEIHLIKQIPLASGLGGGSSDAAATLMGLNDLWGLGMSKEELLGLGAKLGADVPYFINGFECAHGTGRGDILTPLPSLNGQWVVILYPEIPVPTHKTATIYSELSEKEFSDGSKVIDLITALKTKADVDTRHCSNVFSDRIVTELFPGIKEHYRVFKESGAENVAMSGTGPALYTLVSSDNQGRVLSDLLKDKGFSAYSTQLVGSTNE